ncbi:MAG: ABC-F family ATP-binding cassette domain-containing protein [Clostridia bacterium]|nr:ABC-F family ATP-binding cassette domain-containing protein [Clostridia bacterium]
MLQITHLTLTHQRDLRPLVQDLSLTLSRGRLAVIGEEGNGKSSLLKAVADPSALEGAVSVSGTVSAQGERIGYMPQEVETGLDERPVWAWCQEKEGLQDAREAADYCRRVELPTDFIWRDTPLRALSGGERVKLRLLGLMAEKPTLLVLDEPGSDLDVDALEALERFLLTCGLPALYVSHDETLLRRTATAVLHLESLHGRREPRWTLANVPYETYVSQRRASFEKQEQLYQSEKRADEERQERFRRIENAVAHAQENISRRDPSGGRLLKKKMKAVKSLEHRFERERENRTKRPWSEEAIDLTFDTPEPIPNGKTLLDLHLDELTAGGTVLARDLRLTLRGPEHVLLTGPNGCGKTTLLRQALLALQERNDLRVAWMPQRYDELLPDSLSPVDFLAGGGDKTLLTRVRLTLGALRLTREESLRPIGELSGGQKAKVLLLSLVLQHPQALLLDEPTRSLSPLSAPELRALITGFPGAVLCVSHDRELMREWNGRVLRLTPATGLQPLR